MSAAVRTLAFAALLMLPAAGAGAEPEELFPPATPGCYVGTEIIPVAAGAAPYRKPAVPVTAVRLDRGYAQLVHEEEERPPSTEGGRLINLRVIVTFADAGKQGAKALRQRSERSPALLGRRLRCQQLQGRAPGGRHGPAAYDRRHERRRRRL
jgi:hypothetical protein